MSSSRCVRNRASYFEGRLSNPGAESICRIVHGRDNPLRERRLALTHTRRIRGDRSGGNALRIENGKAGCPSAIGAEAGIVEENEARPE